MDIRTLDYHTAGEPLRIIISGLPDIPGASMIEKRRYMADELDHCRRLLMLEPRGHADMYGAVVTAPVSEGADCGVLFLHNEGYSTMCGHGIIALATVAVEHNLFAYSDPGDLRIDTPAGLVRAGVKVSPGGESVAFFENVPAFVLEDAVEIDAGAGTVPATIAFGGAFYAYVDAREVGVALEPSRVGEIIRLGRELKARVMADTPIEHPEGPPELGYLYGVIFTGEGRRPGALREVCVFADGELDRSPTGTGVSGLAAIRHARGEMAVGDEVEVESIIGTTFRVECVAATRVGGRSAVVTRVSGSAHMTGEHRFVLDVHDPLAEGFLIR